MKFKSKWMVLLEKLSTNLLPLLFPCPVPAAPSGSLCGAIISFAFVSSSPFFAISAGWLVHFFLQHLGHSQCF